jgi:hypothetical protein
MFFSCLMSLVVHWFRYAPVKPRLFYTARPRHLSVLPSNQTPAVRQDDKGMKYTFLYLITSLLLALTTTLLLTACFGSSGSSGRASTSTSVVDVPLAQLHWCKKPFMVFRDEGAMPTPTTPATVTATSTPGATATATSGSTPTPTTGARAGTPTTLTDWSQVVTNLGFTVYLPGTLPRNTCLVSAQAIIHDPTFGGSFLIGYVLPDHTSITFSEAPVTSQNTSFACYISNSTSGALSQKNGTPSAGTPQATASPTQLPLQVCSGAKASTNVVLSARRSIEYLQHVFTTLQTNVTWIPAT